MDTSHPSPKIDKGGVNLCQFYKESVSKCTNLKLIFFIGSESPCRFCCGRESVAGCVSHDLMSLEPRPVRRRAMIMCSATLTHAECLVVVPPRLVRGAWVAGLPEILDQ